MTEHEPTPYDALLYPGKPFINTHPGRLATLAWLHGMQPAPVSRCRVLELGCGDGGNLIPMAYQSPDSQFIGIDLSRRSIAAGNERLAGLGLSNISLLHLDVMDIGADFGVFDYEGRKIFWKIDLYDRDYRFYSPAPSDPAKTNRVLTMLLAEES